MVHVWCKSFSICTEKLYHLMKLAFKIEDLSDVQLRHLEITPFYLNTHKNMYIFISFNLNKLYILLNKSLARVDK